MLHYEISCKTDNKIIDFLDTNNNINTSISQSTYSCVDYLTNTKKLIEKNSKSWDIFKKVTNPYEYIHGVVNNKRISKLRPLSRAFYKLIEILHFFNLDLNNTSINSFHLAEGPGGFIEAITYYRNNENDTYYGMTLINDKDRNVPGWKKGREFINNHKNVSIVYGDTLDGNLYSVKNLDCNYKNFKEKFDLITGDGGFDFSVDFNKQEQMATKLILSEILHGLILCKPGGSMIIKCFDLFTTISYESIFLLSSLFDKVYICKPETSRYGNSEKYIVCKHKNASITDEMYLKIKKFFIKLQIAKWDKVDLSILTNEIPSHIFNELNEMNCIFTERQLLNINFTLDIISNNGRGEKVKNLKDKNINNCIEWCKNHDIPYNNINKSNIFLND